MRPKQILVLSLLIFIVAVLTATFYFAIYKPSQPKPAQETQAPSLVKEPPVVDPNSPTALKYFPAGGNAADFRDGSAGDFQVKLDRKGGKIFLRWEENFKVTTLRVVDLGKLWDLSDHVLIWELATGKTGQIATPSAQTLTYLSSPYELGTVPPGTSLETSPKKELEFQKGVRYTIELTARFNAKNQFASYTFNY